MDYGYPSPISFGYRSGYGRPQAGSLSSNTKRVHSTLVLFQTVDDGLVPVSRPIVTSVTTTPSPQSGQDYYTDTDLRLTANVSGGVEPFTFEWQSIDPLGIHDVFVGPFYDMTLTHLGDYAFVVTVTDANGNQDASSVSYTAVEAP